MCEHLPRSDDEFRRAWRWLPYVLIPAVLGVAWWVLARSCGYDHPAIAFYAAYLLGAVWLPGHCLLVWSWRERVRLDQSLALGLPLGFAGEILLYLACAAVGWRGAYPWASLALVLLLAWMATRKGNWHRIMPSTGPLNGWRALLLSVLGLLAMVTAVARMYAASPLLDGLLQHSTHHDWVYLLSRAAEIKNRWPLEDPSLAGTPLSYHYFLMVHVAAAAQTTGVEIHLVLFRFVFGPLWVALLAQVFCLGNLTARSPWGGVLAAFLLLAAGEVSVGESATGGEFQSLFIPWLYVSPTFFFGMVFMGALMLWLHRVIVAEWSPRLYGVLFMLAVVGTGAKGTTVGPLAAAAGLWCGWQMIRWRRWPGRMLLAGGCLGGGFLAAYALFLRGYSGEGTAWQLFAFPQVAPFWVGHMDAWRTQFSEWLPGRAAVSGGLATLALWVAVLVGLNGVLLAGLFHAFRAKTQKEDGFSVWLGLVAVACIAFGNLLFLDSHGESYLYLPMKLPLAILTAAAVTAWWRGRLARARLDSGQERIVLRMLGGAVSALLVTILMVKGDLPWASGLLVVAVVLAVVAPPRALLVTGIRVDWAPIRRFMLRSVAVAPVVLVLMVQVRFFLLSNRSGLALWQTQAAMGSEPSLVELNEGLQWIRRHTPIDAVIIAASFSPEKATPDASQVMDRTTLDKYYYYSAMSRRRMFIEGPSYVRDQRVAAERMQMVADLVAGRPLVLPPALKGRTVYLLYDREAGPPAPSAPPAAILVYANTRIRLYRLAGG